MNARVGINTDYIEGVETTKCYRLYRTPPWRCIIENLISGI
jgi:hypothetical protein